MLKPSQPSEPTTTSDTLISTNDTTAAAVTDEESQQQEMEGGGMLAGQGGLGQNMDDEKCCLVFPIHIGAKLIAFLIFADAIFSVYIGVMMAIDDTLFWGAIHVGCAVPILVGAFISVKFMLSDTPETRAN